MGSHCRFGLWYRLGHKCVGCALGGAKRAVGLCGVRCNLLVVAKMRHDCGLAHGVL